MTICSKSKPRNSPSHLPTQTRCQARTASIFYLPSDGVDHLVTRSRKARASAAVPWTRMDGQLVRIRPRTHRDHDL